MSEYETINENVRDFGNRSYLQVARKRVTNGDDSQEFLVITRGFYDDEDSRRWTKFVTIPDDPDLAEWVGLSLLAEAGDTDAKERLREHEGPAEAQPLGAGHQA